MNRHTGFARDRRACAFSLLVSSAPLFRETHRVRVARPRRGCRTRCVRSVFSTRARRRSAEAAIEQPVDPSLFRAERSAKWTRRRELESRGLHCKRSYIRALRRCKKTVAEYVINIITRNSNGAIIWEESEYCVININDPIR